MQLRPLTCDENTHQPLPPSSQETARAQEAPVPAVPRDSVPFLCDSP